MSVTPPKPHDTLALAAARLSRAAPNTWDDFVKALAVYVEVRKDACVHSVADKVLVSQGKAQQCMELQTLFTEGVKQANIGQQK